MDLHLSKFQNLTKSLFLSLILVSVVLLKPLFANAQAPTALKYPAEAVFLANVSNVYLGPTVSGIVDNYSISPTTLPPGLTFNSNTGVISGMPTAAYPQTIYTITAANAEGSTTKTVSIKVFNTFYNNNNSKVSFLGSNREFKKGTNGTANGDVTLYKDVATIDGQKIDCIITTVSQVGVNSWTSYDQNDVSGTGFSNNEPAFFSPQLTFSNTGGNVHFNFQFILGGTFNDSTLKGTNVTLQNVKLNTYDIDGNGSPNSNQFNQFGGFSNYELASTSSVIGVTYQATTGLTQFRSTTNQNVTNVLDPTTRVRVSYSNMSNFDIVVGSGNGIAYFFLDFSAGSSFTTTTYSSPSLDLNAQMPGNVNVANGCGTSLSFADGNAKSVVSASGDTLNELKITFDAGDIKDGVKEKIVVGSTNIPLNFTNGQAIPSVTVSGKTYNITASVTGSKKVLVFKPTSNSTFTTAEGKALIDALVYTNEADMPTSGERHFILNLKGGNLVSPDAVFTATLNCVAISGNIYHDANALTDNIVNANSSTDQFDANSFYAVLTDYSNDTVMSFKPISNGGAFSFGRNVSGNYNIYVVAQEYINNVSIGNTWNTAKLPSQGGFIFIGENLGAEPGHDLLIDGKLTFTLGTSSVTNANFGLQQKPTATDATLAEVNNPQGFNDYQIPNGSFITDDVDGTVDSIIITGFPSEANYLKVGNVYYLNPSGGICPPQVTCTTWPDSLRIELQSNGNLAQTISVDPSSTSSTTVEIPFRAIDNGRARSDIRKVTIPFFVPTNANFSVSGKIWNDANGDGLQDAGEDLTNPTNAGESFYAVLIQNSNTYSSNPTILDYVVVTNGEYSFENVPSGNDYSVKIYSLPNATPSIIKGDKAANLTPHLADNWIGVSTNNNGVITIRQNTNDLFNSIPNLSADLENINFGIQQIPFAGNGYNNAGGNPGGTIQVEVPSNTFSNILNSADSLPGTIDSIRIMNIPSNATTIVINNQSYDHQTFPPNGVTIPADQNGNPLWTITVDPDFPQEGQISIPFKAIDNAGIESANTGYAILEFSKISIAGKVFDDDNALLDNTVNGSGTNLSNTLNAVLINGLNEIVAVSNVANDGTYNFQDINGEADYTVLITTESVNLGDPAPSVLLSQGWVFAGEYGSVNPGHDGNPDGKLHLGIVNQDTSNINFGIHRLPIALTDSSKNNIPGQIAVVSNIIFNDTEYYNTPSFASTIDLIPNQSTTSVCEQTDTEGRCKTTAVRKFFKTA